jgi:hypothetical protein
VELLGDGTVIKSPFPDAEMENHILDIAKEASIYHRVGPHERLVRILGHSRDGLILEYMKNGDLKTYIQNQKLNSDEPEVEVGIPNCGSRLSPA